MKKLAILLPLVFMLGFPCLSCKGTDEPDTPEGTINATEYGVLSSNSGKENSKNLQNLIDSLTEEGGIIHIPSGEYVFSENGTQTIGAHCIKMQSNVHIVGDGERTVLKPTGNAYYGLDMFYFNDYLDVGEANYLENCRFEDFTIDAVSTSCTVYTSAGKGFMFNLFRDCHWENVTVKNTDATGFGVDCPLTSSMTDCVAIGCGKAADEQNGGASGFGIGFGYADGENIRITNCQAFDNKKFGFFFEHQGRFDSNKYSATATHDFVVSNCNATGNLYNFGGINAMNVVYKNCHSQNARLYGFYFENSAYAQTTRCTSANEADASFVIMQSNAHNVNHVIYESCQSENTPYGAKITSDNSPTMADNGIKNCVFSSVGICTVYTSGQMQSLSLTDNVTSLPSNLFTAEIERFENANNSWN